MYIEIDGNKRFVGIISGDSYLDSRFKYDGEYMASSYGVPISISLPFIDEPFSSEETSSFFESLLPEGFSRRSVAQWIKTDENDYLTILAKLGRESIGALTIVEDDLEIESGYERLSKKDIKKLAEEGATYSTQVLINTHLSLAGASGKVGLYYDTNTDSWYLPKGDAPSTHIIKQSHVRFDKMVLNECMCMNTAAELGLDVPKTLIVDIGNGRDEDVLLAVQRYDRIPDKGRVISERLRAPLRLHQEDFAQALGVSSEKKYETTDSGYLRKMFELIRNYSSNPLEDQRKLLERIVFNYMIGNTDAHLKNFALIYNQSLRGVRLAPAYDMVSTRVYDLSPEMSFYIDGEKDINKVSRQSFINVANEIGMGRKMVEAVFDNIANRIENSLKTAAVKLAENGFEDSIELSKKIL